MAVVGVGGDSVVVWQQINGMGFIDLNANTYSSADGSWGMAGLIENGAGDVYGPRVATDAGGNAIAVWAQDDATGTNTADIFTSRYLAGDDVWSTAELINDGTGDIGFPALAVHTGGVAVTGWQQVNATGAIDVYSNRFE